MSPKFLETKPGYLNNPPILKDGTVNLKIGGLYNIFSKYPKNSINDYIKHYDDTFLLLSIDFYSHYKYSKIPHVKQFTFLHNGMLIYRRYGSTDDNFYFEEIK